MDYEGQSAARAGQNLQGAAATSYETADAKEAPSAVQGMLDSEDYPDKMLGPGPGSRFQHYGVAVQNRCLPSVCRAAPILCQHSETNGTGFEQGRPETTVRGQG